MVEPFRPFVDRLVWRMTEAGHIRDGETTVEERRTLAASLLEEALFDAESVTLLVATERAAESMVRAMEANSAALLLLPRLAA